MDAAAHYRHLLTLGREDFLAAAAPAVLVRSRGQAGDAALTAAATVTVDYSLDAEVGETELRPRATVAVEPAPMDPLELYPLVKKPGASFPDRITIGRTPNNDVVVADASVSRFHAYVRHADAAGAMLVADAGSKNGSWLDGATLEPRREAQLVPGAELRLGDVRLAFYLARDLFDMLGGDHDRR